MWLELPSPSLMASGGKVEGNACLDGGPDAPLQAHLGCSRVRDTAGEKSDIRMGRAPYPLRFSISSCLAVPSPLFATRAP